MEPLSILLLLKWLSGSGAPPQVITPGPTPVILPQGAPPTSDVVIPHGGAAGVPADKNASDYPATAATTSPAATSSSPAPAATPPFSGRGGPNWEPDIPPPPSVVKRAWALLDSLWAKGVGSYVTEVTNGRPITYLAEWHGTGIKGVTAFRLKGSGSSVSGMPAYGYLYG